MHMLFQSEAAYRRRRSWLPRTGGDLTALAVRQKNAVLIGPARRPRARGKSRNCRTVKIEEKRSRKPSDDNCEPEVELDRDSSDDNQEEDDEDDAVALQDELQAMQIEIECLQRRRLLMDSALVNARTNAVAHAIDLTKGFYVHFSNGYDPVNQPVQSQQAAEFLRGIMCRDVICTEFRGVDLFLNQYKVCTESHATMRVFVHNIVVINEHQSSQCGAIQVLAKAVARFRVNRTTLETLFPGIIKDEVLAQQLIGKEYAIQYDKVFHFQHGRVFQHESQIDFCSSMLEMTQNPFVAMKLVEASLMTKHGHLKVDSCIEEDMNQLENSVL